MNKHAEFLNEIEAFMLRHDMAKTVFGLKAAGRMGFVKRVREGGGVLMTTEDRVRSFMRKYDQEQSRAQSRQKKRASSKAA